MALSRIDTTNMIEDVPQSKIDNNINFRNLIINGSMDLAQRGDVTGANSSGYKAIDRYRHTISIATWSISQSTDVPSGQGFAKSMKMDCTTAEASPPSASALAFVQKIEGQNLQYLKKGTSSAESLTVSFWVKSNKTGTAQVNLVDQDNTRMIGKQWSISSADTWEKKTLTFAGDTSGALGNDNNSSLRCEIWLDAGSSYKSGATPTSWESLNTADYFAGGTLNLGDNTANEIYITGLQLEAGQTASEFEFLPYDVNLQRCERYYQVIVDIPGDGIADTTLSWGYAFQYNSSTIYSSYFFRTVMRAPPTLDQVTGSNNYSFYRNQAADHFSGISQINNANTTCFEWVVTANISGTAGQAGFLRTNDSTCFIALDSEL